jgi:hypothetical protein
MEQIEKLFFKTTSWKYNKRLNKPTGLLRELEQENNQAIKESLNVRWL